MNRSSATLRLLALVALVSAACGIPEDRQPTVTPGGVVNPAVAPGDVDARIGDGASPAEVDTTLYLVQAEHLVKVVRRTRPIGLTSVLQLLLEGPKEDEFGAGIRTAISPQTTLQSARQDGHTAVISLTTAFVEVGGQEQILAVAQIVLTATAVPDVAEVRILLDGQAVEVPRPDGTLSSEPARAADYDRLLRPSP